MSQQQQHHQQGEARAALPPPLMRGGGAAAAAAAAAGGHQPYPPPPSMQQQQHPREHARGAASPASSLSSMSIPSASGTGSGAPSPASAGDSMQGGLPHAPRAGSLAALAACPGPDLSHHFDDPFLSDFQLRLVSPEGSELGRFHVHGIVLAGQSGYFKSLLQNWMGRDARLFSITVTEEEAPAARAMLQCAYSHAMPPEADAQQLLATMILADRYQLRMCVEACKQRLLELDNREIAWGTALAMLHLPPGLQEGEAFSALTEKAHSRVFDQFSSLDDAWTSKQLRAQWLQLPLEGVERLLSNPNITAASENVVYVVLASWLAAQLRHASDAAEAARLQGLAGSLLGAVRFPHMSGNFLAAVAAHHHLLAGQAGLKQWLLEAVQWSKAGQVQRRDMAVCARHDRYDQRVGEGLPRAPPPEYDPNPPPPLSPRSRGPGGGGSAFTSYIAASDLQQAISKYRASGCSEAYYLLTAGHFYNGFTWRLKLTVKPPDAGSPNEMNIHVGLCWGIELEGEGPLPLSEATMVQVDFDIATWDFVLHEEDPTSSEGPVIIKAGTCWGWDDFFGPEVYTDSSLWSKFMTDKQQLLLSCHLYSCA